MKGHRGFSLIELMIALAIITIIGAIAYPSYQRHVLKARRATAEGCLVELAQWMERYYTTNMKYKKSDTDPVLPNTSCRNDLANFYTFEFAPGEPTATTYRIQATAIGEQAGDKEGDTLCTPLTIDQQGSREPDGCW